MSLPVTFATLTGGNQPLSLLDTQFAAVGALGAIPCACSGQNALTLTPLANTPTVSSYTDLQPSFVFTAAQTCTSAVTANVNLIGSRNVYKANGQIAVGSGDFFAGDVYRLTYLSALNGGLGGFIADVFSGNALLSAMEFVIGGGGVAITPGVKGYLSLPYAAVIGSWSIMADQSGSISIDVWRLNAGIPLLANSIVGGGTKPNLSSAQAAFSVTPSGWTSTVLAPGDIIGFFVNTSSVVTQVTISINLVKL